MSKDYKRYDEEEPWSVRIWRWLPTVAIIGSILALYYYQENIRKTSFKEGIDCIVVGEKRLDGRFRKRCSDYYSNERIKLRLLIRDSPDTKVGNIEKDIWKRHLLGLQHLRENGLSDTFFKSGL